MLCTADFEAEETALSRPTAIFRLSSGRDLRLLVSLHLSATSTIAADIAFRFLQRFSLATAERLERLLSATPGDGHSETDGPSLAAAGDALEEGISAGAGRMKSQEAAIHYSPHKQARDP